MRTSEAPYRLIISGGGTGGHVYPAIAIAHAFKAKYPNAAILFVGAIGKMEMTRVPQAGFRIEGLNIAGFRRSFDLSNLVLPFKVLGSILKARRIISSFRPDVAIGTGGYASGPLMWVATRRGIPALLQEQNSYAGLTNRQLAGKVKTICVAYPGMERYFPGNKVVMTGNPVRKDIISLDNKYEKACRHFGLNPAGKTLLVLGGSGGARTINESILAGLEQFKEAGVQIVWQTGRAYYEHVQERVAGRELGLVRIYDFLTEMDLAYAAAHVVVSRAGALSISELCLAKKPAILVPSPNVAEDHQTKNASALAEVGAARMISDRDAVKTLAASALALLRDETACTELGNKIAALARPQAAEAIVEEIEKLIA